MGGDVRSTHRIAERTQIGLLPMQRSGLGVNAASTGALKQAAFEEQRRLYRRGFERLA